VAPSDVPSAANVRAELHRILASDIFARSERLSAYLSFIVERTLAGEGQTLKEQVIATALYGKASDFSTAGDPIVRVDARRLRDRLREYYASAPPGVLVISVPKGTYTPEFTATEPAATSHEQVATPPATPWRPAPRWWVAAAVPAAMVVAAWLVVSRLNRQGAEATRLLTVTSLPGAENDPSLSPDGKFVAFSWAGATGAANSRIWVKAVDTDDLRQLTATPGASDFFPAWSPDGRIAFTREVMGRSSTWIVSALGGPEKMIEERSSWESWLPDGKSLVLVSHSEGRDSLVLHGVDSGVRKPLTEAPVGFIMSHPKVSADGKAAAFLEYGEGRSAVFLETLSGGELTQLVEWTGGLFGGLAWTPDGRDILFGKPETSGRRLVRVTVGSPKPATPVVGVPLESLPGSASRRPGGGYRLAIASGQPEISLQLVDLQAPPTGATFAAATTLCHSTRMDAPGRFSPDASLVAFVSNRSGSQQVWIARRDQSECRRVTELPDATLNIGSWSPDSRRIAFDATMGGNTGVYVVSVDGGSATRLTGGQAAETDPEWSRDGHWIYYASNETGRSEIWKMSPDGRTRARLTSEGGFEPRESSDGQFVYFVSDRRGYALGPATRLERIPPEGGAASLVYPAVVSGAWSVAGDRVVFLVARPDSFRNPQPDVVASYDLVHRRVDVLGALPFRIAPNFITRFLIVSPNGRWALAPHVERWDRDIFVLDNYR
jgi:Tol biopolymer transport system component